jgi:hypothetical protein
VFDAALASNKPTLADFVSGVPVTDPSPVDSCEIKVAVGLVGAKVAPNVVPKPNPLRLANNSNFPGDSTSSGSGSNRIFPKIPVPGETGKEQLTFPDQPQQTPAATPPAQSSGPKQ